jgi:hypothetical protein
MINTIAAAERGEPWGAARTFVAKQRVRAATRCDHIVEVVDGRIIAPAAKRHL